MVISINSVMLLYIGSCFVHFLSSGRLLKKNVNSGGRFNLFCEPGCLPFDRKIRFCNRCIMVGTDHRMAFRLPFVLQTFCSTYSSKRAWKVEMEGNSQFSFPNERRAVPLKVVNSERDFCKYYLTIRLKTG